MVSVLRGHGSFDRTNDIRISKGCARRTVIVGLIPFIALFSLFVEDAIAQASPQVEVIEEAEGVEADALLAESARTALVQFTTGIENREPIDQVTFIGTNLRKIYFFSDLRGFEGTVVTHNWLYDGESQAKVEFEVKGPRWRVWSSKDLKPKWVGDWTVEIVTADGEVLAAETFTYSEVRE